MERALRCSMLPLRMKATLPAVLALLALITNAFADTTVDTAKQKEIMRVQELERRLIKEELNPTQAVTTHQISAPLALPDDTDDDGMPNSWETAKGLNPNDPTDAWGDADGDQVLNLFEYQLAAGPNNPATPPFVTVGPPGSDYTSVAAAIDTVAPGTVLRLSGVFQGSYNALSAKSVMLQGGWNSDFSERHLRKHPTVLMGPSDTDDEILYFSVSSGENVLILDGIHFRGGKGFFGAVAVLAAGDSSAKTSLYQCTIANSDASSSGGVLYLNNRGTSDADVTIANTAIGNNQANGIDSSVTDSAIARWRIVHSTITENGGEGYGIDLSTLDSGQMSARVTNSIIWGNEQLDMDLRNFGTTVVFNADHSDVGEVDDGFGDPIYFAGTGMLDTDPLFVDAAKSNFHLTSSSPVIDQANNAGIPSADFEGDPRVLDNGPDMGADEFLNISADAGVDQVVCCEAASLEGSGTTIAGRSIASYAWELEHRTDSANDVTATGQSVSFNNLSDGFYDGELQVTDSEGATAKDSFVLAVSGQCGGVLDINEDGRLSVEDAVYILQVLYGKRDNQ